MKRLSSVIAAFLLVSVVHAADMSNSMELTQLYIIGSATPYQWDVSSTPDMERVADGVFRWSGRLEAGGEFKFVNTREFTSTSSPPPPTSPSLQATPIISRS